MRIKHNLSAYIDLGMALALAGLAYLCYDNILSAEFFHSWDDKQYVTQNARIRDLGPAGLWQIWSQPHYLHYIPVTLMSYALDYRLWELNAFGYHFTNLLLHALNGILSYLLCLRLQSSRVAAALAAALFVIHPLQVESVAWISERKNLLSLTFFLCAFLTHIRSRHIASNDGPKAAYQTQGFAWGFFLCAVLSKSIVAFTPLLFIAYDIAWQRRGAWHSLLTNLPYVIMGAGGAAGAILAHQGSPSIATYWGGSFWLTAVLMLRVAWEYLVSLIYPLHLNNYYFYTVDMIQGDPKVWAGAGVLILAACFAWRQPLGRPLSRFAILWCATFMLPVANLFPFGFQRADRYLYHPSPLLFLLAGVAGVHIYRHVSQRYTRAALVSGFGLFMVALLVLTLQRVPIWMTSETLWQAHLQDRPESPTGLLNLGVYYHNRRDRQQRDYEHCYDLLTKSIRLRSDRRRVHYYLARCAFESGRREEARDIFENAIERWPQHDRLHSGYGYVAYHLGHDQAAMNAYHTALTINPENRDAQDGIVNLGRRALQRQNYAMSRQAFSYMQRLQPGHPAATGGLCQTLVGLKQMSEALPWCQQAVDQLPKSPRYRAQLALVMLRLSQLEPALRQAQRAVDLSPNWGFGHRLLGDINCARGRRAEAEMAYRQALAINPKNPISQKRLANLCHMTQ